MLVHLTGRVMENQFETRSFFWVIEIKFFRHRQTEDKFKLMRVDAAREACHTIVVMIGTGGKPLMPLFLDHLVCIPGFLVYNVRSRRAALLIQDFVSLPGSQYIANQHQTLQA